MIQIGSVQIDIDRHEVLVKGSRSHDRGVQALVILLKAGRVFTAADHRDNSRGVRCSDRPRVDDQVVRFGGSAKLGRNIETVRGVGYRFRD